MFGSDMSCIISAPPGLMPVGRDDVAGERLARERIDREPGRAAGEAGAAEVAVALGRGGDVRDADVAALVLVLLVREEEVELVLDDRAAEGAAEVVPLQGRLLLARLLQEEVRRVELVAAGVVVAAAVELVASRRGSRG